MHSSTWSLLALLLISPTALSGDLYQTGKAVFTEQAQPSCTLCHTLSNAGSAGEIGPNLDDLQPTAEQVANAVTSGVGIMPAFEGMLTAEQIEAVAHYVSQSTRP